MKFWENKIYQFLGLYFLIKIFSYFFSPDTPLYSANPINTLVSILILSFVCYLLIKKNQLGWLIIAGEIILGGSGGYFAIFGISLRTLLLVSSTGIYTLQKLRFSILKNTKHYTYYLVPLFLILWVSFSAFNGFLNGHNLNKIYSDFIPYFYLLYTFPLKNLLKDDGFKKYVWQILIASIIGNAIFILFTFFGFTFEIFVLQDAFYHWYRDIALGKITSISTGFFRITLDEHLLLIPIALILLYKILDKKLISSNYYLFNTLYFLTLVILSINITRIYMIALFVGYLFLFSKKYWGSWVKYGILTGVIFLISFSSLNLIASKGQSSGLELLGLRIGSIVAPQTEDSSLSRMLLLPEILDKIKENPIIGSGLGDTITVYSPVLEKQITTSHFDWGYLEIIAELGLVGFLFWVSLISLVIVSILRNSLFSNYRSKYENINLYIVPLIALLLINITSPALFHPLGILFIAIIFSNLKNPIFFSSSAGGIIINPENKVAIVSNISGKYWTFPKGTVEKNESIEQTALREIYEETGIKDLKKVDYFYNYHRLSRFKNKLFIKKISLYIFYTETTKELIPIDNDNPEAKWINIDEVENELSNQKDKKIFLKYKYKLTKWKR